MKTLTEHREYNKKWISHKKMLKMSQTDLKQFLTNNGIDIPFINYNTDDLHELCFQNKLVNSFTTRGRKHKGITKYGLLKLCQKFITEYNSDDIYDTFGQITITLTNPNLNKK